MKEPNCSSIGNLNKLNGMVPVSSLRNKATVKVGRVVQISRPTIYFVFTNCSLQTYQFSAFRMTL